MQHLLLIFTCLFALILGIVFVMLGWGMRHYDPWSRNPARFAAFVMMFFVPLGTLIGITCFCLLKKRANKEIFTNKYHAILLRDPLRKESYKLWLPMLIGALTAILLTLAGVWYRHFIVELLVGEFID